MRPTSRSSLPAILAAAAAMAPVTAVAQAQTATVVVSHNDPDGIVSPGESVEVTTTVSWTGPWALREIRGGVRTTPDIGVASSPRFPYTIQPSPFITVNPGVASLGSVEGVRLEYTDLVWLLFFGFPAYPFGVSSGIEVVRFDWTAPVEPGVVNFDWIPETGLPEPLMVYSGAILAPIPTTYLGTSLTVFPAPPAAAVAGLGLALSAPRRRRPGR